jgi:hypothetical protein
VQESSANSYSDDPDDFDEDPQRRKLPALLAFLLLLVGGTYFVQTTLSANINLNSGPVEFGQGITQATSCDSQIRFKPVSSFTDRLWTVVDENNIHQDGFIVSDFIVSDIANSCQGKQFIINAYGDTSPTPLNAFPLIVNYVPDFGGYFTFEVDSPNTIQAFLPDIRIDTTTAGEGSLGATNDQGSSFFQMGDWASLYSNPGQVDARLVKKYTIQTQNIPTNSLKYYTCNLNKYLANTSKLIDNHSQ